MIEDIKKNIEEEIKILREISGYKNKSKDGDEDQRKLIEEAVKSLSKKIKIINNSIPEILNEIKIEGKPLPKESVNEQFKKTALERVNVETDSSKYDLVLKKGDRERFFRELDINESYVKRIKKGKGKIKKREIEEYKSPRGYLKYANKYFLNLSRGLIERGYFRGLSPSLRKANIDILLQTYISMIFFSVVLSFFFGMLFVVFLMFFNLGFEFPFVTLYQGSYSLRILKIFWIPFALPVFVFIALYFYPNTERGSIEKKIDKELPFAVVHMSAIAGSGIEPTKIFGIIGTSREYPALGKEIRKILNQINLYGYDLTTALTNISKTTPSSKLSELFAGLSTTINSGGDLSEFFEKRSQTLMLSYRLEREKFSKIAETFMDIYISLVIATPMILLLLIIMISVSGIEIGFSPDQISILIVMVVAIVNLIFVGVLHLKQPAY